MTKTIGLGPKNALLTTQTYTNLKKDFNTKHETIK